MLLRATLSGGPWPVPNTIWAKKKIKKKRFCLVRALIKVFFDASREQRGSTREGDVNEVDETYSVCFSSFVETEAKSIHRCRSDSPQSASPRSVSLRSVSSPTSIQSTSEQFPLDIDSESTQTWEGMCLTSIVILRNRVGVCRFNGCLLFGCLLIK